MNSIVLSSTGSSRQSSRCCITATSLGAQQLTVDGLRRLKLTTPTNGRLDSVTCNNIPLPLVSKENNDDDDVAGALNRVEGGKHAWQEPQRFNFLRRYLPRAASSSRCVCVVCRRYVSSRRYSLEIASFPDDGGSQRRRRQLVISI